MKIFGILLINFILLVNVFGRSPLNIASIDERSVCKIKDSCSTCLRLSHCSWCGSENKCFSKELSETADYCQDNATHYTDFGLSFEENSYCTCFGEDMVKNCHPPGLENELCSGRGTCECGRCVCTKTPDPNNLTKVIMGEYCEFDNFSCDGPRCNEGPYYLYQVNEPSLRDMLDEEDM